MRFRTGQKAGLILAIVLWSASLAAQPANLRGRLDALLGDPALGASVWGAKVVSLPGGEILYERNARLLLVPASNLKLVTAIAAIRRLGLDYRFTTRIETDGEIRGGVLQGNLIIRGSGDPTLGARPSSPDLEHMEAGNPWEAFDSWAQQLKALGIHTIRGDLVGDDSLLAPAEPSPGWAWDDLAWGYASPAGGLLFNENLVLLHVVTGEPGSVPRLEIVPDLPFLQVVSNVKTARDGELPEIQLTREVGENVTTVNGSVRPYADQWRSVSAGDPTRYFMSALRRAINRAGIELEGTARFAGDREQAPARLLFRHDSRDLRYVLRVLLKTSHNLYAEVLARIISPDPRRKSLESGIGQIEEMLTEAGLEDDAYFIVDGSGLSRYNLLSADALTGLLRYAVEKGYGRDLRDCLPVAGVDGSLKERLQGTAAAGRVFAKTGSLKHVRALSGYVEAKDGRLVAFSIIANNVRADKLKAETVQDRFVEILSSEF